MFSSLPLKYVYFLPPLLRYSPLSKALEARNIGWPDPEKFAIIAFLFQAPTKTNESAAVYEHNSATVCESNSHLSVFPFILHTMSLHIDTKMILSVKCSGSHSRSLIRLWIFSTRPNVVIPSVKSLFRVTHLSPCEECLKTDEALPPASRSSKMKVGAQYTNTHSVGAKCSVDHISPSHPDSFHVMWRFLLQCATGPARFDRFRLGSGSSNLFATETISTISSETFTTAVTAEKVTSWFQSLSPENQCTNVMGFLLLIHDLVSRDQSFPLPDFPIELLDVSLHGCPPAFPATFSFLSKIKTFSPSSSLSSLVPLYLSSTGVSKRSIFASDMCKSCRTVVRTSSRQARNDWYDRDQQQHTLQKWWAGSLHLNSHDVFQCSCSCLGSWNCNRAFAIKLFIVVFLAACSSPCLWTDDVPKAFGTICFSTSCCTAQSIHPHFTIAGTLLHARVRDMQNNLP